MRLPVRSLSVQTLPVLILGLLVLSGCAGLPDLELSDAEFDQDTPYPEFVPLDVLLKEPEATITDETESTLDARREELVNTPLSPSGDTNDALQQRIDALRKRQQELSTGLAASEDDLDDRLRDRLENGIQPPNTSE